MVTFLIRDAKLVLEAFFPWFVGTNINIIFILSAIDSTKEV